MSGRRWREWGCRSIDPGACGKGAAPLPARRPRTARRTMPTAIRQTPPAAAPPPYRPSTHPAQGRVDGSERPWALAGEGQSPSRVYPTSIRASRTIRPISARCSATNRAKVSGSVPTGSAPSASSRCRTVASASACFAASYSRCTIGAGVPAGRVQPVPLVQLVALETLLRDGWHVRQRRDALRRRHAERHQPPVAHELQSRGDGCRRRKRSTRRANPAAPGVPPRYGTCVTSNPARLRNSAAARCAAVALPEEP
jgi:hypothetical protein